MKNYAIVLATIFMLFFTSCESWLDIQQEGKSLSTSCTVRAKGIERR